MNYGQIRDQAASVGAEIDFRLAEAAPESISIAELYDGFVGQSYDERAIRTAIWDRINSDKVEIIGGSALLLVSGNLG